MSFSGTLLMESVSCDLSLSSTNSRSCWFHQTRFIADASVSRPTPLYGQPSWWGEDDEHQGQRCDPSVHEHHTGQKQRVLNHQNHEYQK